MMCRLLALMLVLFCACPVLAQESSAVVRIGVTAINGKEEAIRHWESLAQALERAVPDRRFVIVPVGHGENEALLKEGRLQFLLLGPTFYVDFEVRHGISRMATLVRTTSKGTLSSLGGVVAVRANSKDIKEPKDLRKKSVIGTHAMALGGWMSQIREFKILGLSENDFSLVRWAPTYEAAVLDMLEGKADAAFVRTGAIEKMIRDGRIAASEVKVLRFAAAPIGYPLEISTRSYPEWAFAKTLSASDDLAKRVVLALMDLPAAARVRNTAGIDGFTVPLDYAPVHDLMRDMKVGPYALPHSNGLIDVIQMHGSWVIGGAILLIVLSAAVMGMATVSRRLALSRVETMKMRDDLETIVISRTRELEAEVERRRQVEAERHDETAKIKESLVRTVKAVALTVEMRDPYMAGHQQRVAQLAMAIASEMKLSPEMVECIYLSGLVHDIGMIYVPSEITNRPGPLSDLEYEIVKNHPRIGHDIMSTVDLPWPIASNVLNHHRRLDGKGYPEDVEGDIPLEARILGVADVVEAMCSHRPYRPPLGIGQAMAEIEAGKGSRFDADVVDACLRLVAEKGSLIWN
ncbi:MAG: PhnD/SsuA/transferrin family substrate-binding protein [Rhodospirillales bacterium]|nr:PhnD/SsuA/transferrin family substrate-binding protein [Rhodospirillales bacterium]